MGLFNLLDPTCCPYIPPPLPLATPTSLHIYAVLSLDPPPPWSLNPALLLCKEEARAEEANRSHFPTSPTPTPTPTPSFPPASGSHLYLSELASGRPQGLPQLVLASYLRLQLALQVLSLVFEAPGHGLARRTVGGGFGVGGARCGEVVGSRLLVNRPVTNATRRHGQKASTPR